MKRAVILVCMLFLLAGVCVDAATGSNTAQISKLVDFLVLGTGSMTGTYFPLGNAFANVWSTRGERLGVLAHSTQGSLENIRLLQRQEINLAIAQSDIVLAAINGTGQFAGEKIADLRILMALFPEVVQIVTAADAGIKTIDQLRQKRIVVGARGSGNAQTSVELLSAFGIGPDEYQPVYLSYDESIQAMERKECDAAIIIAGIPTKVVEELAARMPIAVMNFSPEETAGLVQTLPYLSAVRIPPRTYGDSSEVNTLALMAMLVGSTRLTEDLGYRLCRTMFAELEYLQTIHERARDIKPETVLNGIPEGFMHQGADRFFSELNSGGQNQ